LNGHCRAREGSRSVGSHRRHEQHEQGATDEHRGDGHEEPGRRGGPAREEHCVMDAGSIERTKVRDSRSPPATIAPRGDSTSGAVQTRGRGSRADEQREPSTKRPRLGAAPAITFGLCQGEFRSAHPRHGDGHGSELGGKQFVARESNMGGDLEVPSPTIWPQSSSGVEPCGEREPELVAAARRSGVSAPPPRHASEEHGEGDQMSDEVVPFQVQLAGTGAGGVLTHHHHPDRPAHPVRHDEQHHYYARHQSPPLPRPSLSEARQRSGWRGSNVGSAVESLPSHPSRHGNYGDRGPSRVHSPKSLPAASGDEFGR
jgi:hypothetical protein